jgi:PAS domain S-box-containing protein
VDGLVVSAAEGDQVFTLTGADHPYRVMVETMNEGAVTLASDGTILYCNQRFADIVQGALERVLGYAIHQYFSPKDLPLFEALLEQGLKGNRKMELALQTGGGNSTPVLLSVSPLQPTDMPGAVCMVVADLTEQKRNEEMRIEEEALQKAHDELEQRVEERTVELSTALSEIKTMKDQLEAENIYFRQEIKMRHKFAQILGQSDGLKYVLYRAEQVAPMNTTVLILGETGTGKELIAAAIHNMSPRKNRPLITVNCAALPASLIESELFGREKGAFTGADTRQVGRFEVANGSTLCLDEIGELPLEMQAKLLRVIQHNEFERLGSSHTIKVDVRIVATTNRNLEEEVRKGTFRQDLFYRLNVFPVTVPPLRQRKEDIPLMVQAFIERYSRKLGKQITSIQKETMKTLQDYPWPGNVRELENIIERAVILCPGPVLQLADILEIQSPQFSSTVRTLEETERNQILKMLSETRWRIEGKNGAAAILGLHPSTLRARMHNLGVVRPETKGPD